MHQQAKKECHYQLCLCQGLKHSKLLLFCRLLLKKLAQGSKLLIEPTKHNLNHLSLPINKSFHHSPKTLPKVS